MSFRISGGSIALVGLSAVLLLAPAHAQDTGGVAAPQDRKSTVLKNRAPLNNELLRVKLPRPKQFTLSNGIRVFVFEDKRAPTISASLSVVAGSLFEDKPGVASLTASQLTEGTTTKTSQQLTDATEKIGANLNSGASGEKASISVSGLNENTDELIALLADVLLHPSFPEDRLNRAKFRQAAGIAQMRTNPDFLASQATARIFYGDTPYGKGSPSAPQIQAITAADLRAYYEKMYRPNGAILAITGDVNAKDIVGKFEKALGGWKPSSGAEPALPTANFAPKEKAAIYLIDRPGAAQSVLTFGNLAIRRTDPDYFPLIVATRILGGGFTSRLNQNLREDKGYTYGARWNLSTGKWPGTWSGGAGVRTEVTGPAVGEFFKEFARIQNETVPTAELEQAKRSIIGNFALTLESPAQMLSRTVDVAEYGLPTDYWDTYAQKIEAVTAAEVQRVAKKYLGEGRVQLIVVGERSKIEEALTPYGTIIPYEVTP
jgi:zinc protease